MTGAITRTRLKGVQLLALFTTLVPSCAVADAALANASPLETPASNAETQAAIDSIDIERLRLLAATNAQSPEAALARGAHAAFLNQPEIALSALREAAQANLGSPLSGQAQLLISAVLMREGQYAGAAAALASARHLMPDKFGEESERTLSFMRALAAEAPMSAEVPTEGVASLSRDSAGLLRSHVNVNDEEVNAVVDTGAAFSTISESLARRVGLRMLPGTVQVGTATNAVEARIGVADTLHVGNAIFFRVPFIVLEDRRLSFAGGLYQIDAIVGLPVLMRLGRLAFLLSDRVDHELRFSRESYPAEGRPNLILDGLQPTVLARSADAELRLLLDTGARRTTLTSRINTDAPRLVVGARQGRSFRQGAGGAVRDRSAIRIPALDLQIGDRLVRLQNIEVVDRPQAKRHGQIGQDVLQSADGFIVDFRAMRLELVAGEGPPRPSAR